MIHLEVEAVLDTPEPKKGSPGEPAAQLKLVRILRKILSIIIVFCILSIAFITVLNVITRDIFAHPLTGMDDIVQYLLPLLIFAGLPIVTANEAHFSVNLFTGRLRGESLRIQKNMIRFVTLIATSLIVLEMIEQVQSLSSSNITTNILQLPMAPLFVAVSVLSVITVLLVIVNFLIANISKKGI